MADELDLAGWMELAATRRREGDFVGAAAAYASATDAAAVAGNVDTYVEAANEHGCMLSSLRRYETALDVWQHALERLRRTPAHPPTIHHARLWMNSANRGESIERFERAIALYDELLITAPAVAQRTLVLEGARSRIGLGGLLTDRMAQRDLLDVGLAMLQPLLTARITPAYDDAVHACLRLGERATALGLFADAVVYHQRAVDLAEQVLAVEPDLTTHGLAVQARTALATALAARDNGPVIEATAAWWSEPIAPLPITTATGLAWLRYGRARDGAAALTAFARAIAQLDQVAQASDDPEPIVNAAVARVSRALSWPDSSEWQRIDLVDAIALLAPLVAAGHVVARAESAEAQHRLARRACREGRYTDAMAHSSRAVELAEGVVDDEPTAAAQLAFAVYCASSVLALAGARRYAAAIAEADDVMGLLESELATDDEELVEAHAAIVDGLPTWIRKRDADTSQLACSFCARLKRDVTTLVSGPRVFVCDRCVGTLRALFESRSTIAVATPCSFCGVTRDVARGPRDICICLDCVGLAAEIVEDDRRATTPIET